MLVFGIILANQWISLCTCSDQLLYIQLKPSFLLIAPFVRILPQSSFRSDRNVRDNPYCRMQFKRLSLPDLIWKIEHFSIKSIMIATTSLIAFILLAKCHQIEHFTINQMFLICLQRDTTRKPTCFLSRYFFKQNSDIFPAYLVNT